MDHWDTSTINLPHEPPRQKFSLQYQYSISNQVTRIYTKKSKMSSGSDHMAMKQILANQSLIIISIIFLNEYWMTIDCKFIPLWLKNASIFIIMTIDTLVGNAHHQGLWLWRWMGPLLSYLFSALWVLPLFWLSKPLNSLWYQVTFYLCCLYHQFHLYSFAFQFEFFSLHYLEML